MMYKIIINTGIFLPNGITINDFNKVDYWNEKNYVYWSYHGIQERIDTGMKFGFVITKINQPKL